MWKLVLWSTGTFKSYRLRAKTCFCPQHRFSGVASLNFNKIHLLISAELGRCQKPSATVLSFRLLFLGCRKRSGSCAPSTYHRVKILIKRMIKNQVQQVLSWGRIAAGTILSFSPPKRVASSMFIFETSKMKVASYSRNHCVWFTWIFLRRNQRKDFTALTFPDFCLYDTGS